MQCLPLKSSFLSLLQLLLEPMVLHFQVCFRIPCRGCFCIPYGHSLLMTIAFMCAGCCLAGTA